MVVEISFGHPPPVPQGETALAVSVSEQNAFHAAANLASILFVQEDDDPVGREVSRQVEEFLLGHRRAFDVPLDWSVLPPAHGAILKRLYETVPWGTAITYGELAAEAGYLGAARAVGAACRMNPFPIVVPAHRVIAAGNRIGGFLGRPDIKRKLLEREGLGPFRD